MNKKRNVFDIVMTVLQIALPALLVVFEGIFIGELVSTRLEDLMHTAESGAIDINGFGFAAVILLIIIIVIAIVVEIALAVLVIVAVLRRSAPSRKRHITVFACELALPPIAVAVFLAAIQMIPELVK